MSYPVHRWGVQLAIGPDYAAMLFMHSSKSTGLQVLDEMFWPLGPDIRTERAYLQELYAGVLAFQELRA